MTKTLTEQWEDGTLPEGHYYIRWSYDVDDEPSYMIDFCDTENFTGGEFINKQRKFIDEVMCAVPAYDEWKRLQAQLKEANELIKDFGDEYPVVVKDYLKKWGVK